MKLYYAAGACSLAPHIALREIGATFTLVRYDIPGRALDGGGQLDDVNDKGFVPVLELDDGQRLTEVPAVLQYIADRAPALELAPAAGTMERYRLMEWLNFIATELHKVFWPLFHGGDEVENRKAREKIAHSLSWVENKLGDRPFLMGEKFTVADTYLLTILNWTRAVNIDLGELPRIKQYRARMRERPSVVAALEAEGFKR